MKSTKRTTVIFDEKDREYLAQLIREGKESSIKSFLTKMLDIYRNMAVYDWKFPGECYVGVSRVALFSMENLNVLANMIPEGKLRETGKKLGEATALALRAEMNLETGKPDSWPRILQRLRIFGYGDIVVKERFLVVKNPYIGNLNLLGGFLEGLLQCTLETRNTAPPVVFELTGKQT